MLRKIGRGRDAILAAAFPLTLIRVMSKDPYSPPTASLTRKRPVVRQRHDFVGFLPRVVAMFLDSMLFGAAYVALYFVLGTSLLDMQNPDEVSGPMTLFFYIAPAAVVLAFWMTKGATPGKMFMGIKVVDFKTGGTASFGKCLVRYACYFVSSMPLCLGYFWVLWGKDKRAWHDLISGTAVVRAR